MPLMMSLTKVCAPNPIATPTTPAPAISGPISIPMEDSVIKPAMTMRTMNSTFRRMGRSVRSRDCRRACSLSGSAGSRVWVSLRSMAALMRCHAKSAISTITMALKAPRRSRVGRVLRPESSIRSMPQT